MTPARKTILIDGGVNRRALGFLAWKYRLDRPNTNPVDIDLLVMSHADSDHLEGLVPIIGHPKVKVRNVIHSGIATFASGHNSKLGTVRQVQGTKYLVSRHTALADLPATGLSGGFQGWATAIAAANVNTYTAVDSSTLPIVVGDPDISIEVLGPRLDTHPTTGDKMFRWFGDESHTINGHSVTVKISYRDIDLIFPGDLNIQGARHLLTDPSIANRLHAHVFKAPHHGSHEYEPDLLDAIRPQISVISSGDDPDHGHPRANYIGAAGLYSRSSEPLVFSTEIAATFVDTAPPVPAPGAGVSTGGETLETLDVAAPDAFVKAHQLFKRRLHGMINVRTDGDHLYAARRVAAGYWWESYGPVTAVPRWQA